MQTNDWTKRSELMALFTDVFGYERFTFRDIRQISYSNHDVESLEDALAFVGIPWTDITPLMLKKHFEAFSFFTNFAFLVYAPALISCSLQDANTTHLSIEVFLNTLLETKDLQALNTLNSERWRQFSRSQLELIASWINDSNAEFLKYFERDEIAKFSKCLAELVHQATEFEKQWPQR